MSEDSFEEGFATFCPNRAGRKPFTEEEKQQMRDLKIACDKADRELDTYSEYDA